MYKVVINTPNDTKELRSFTTEEKAISYAESITAQDFEHDYFIVEVWEEIGEWESEIIFEKEIRFDRNQAMYNIANDAKEKVIKYFKSHCENSIYAGYMGCSFYAAIKNNDGANTYTLLRISNHYPNRYRTGIGSEAEFLNKDNEITKFISINIFSSCYSDLRTKVKAFANELYKEKNVYMFDFFAADYLFDEKGANEAIKEIIDEAKKIIC